MSKVIDSVDYLKKLVFRREKLRNELQSLEDSFVSIEKEISELKGALIGQIEDEELD